LTTAKHPHNTNKGRKFRANYLTPAEAQAIFDACPDNPVGIRNRALLVLMYYSGLRVGEALSLETGSIDLDARTIRLDQTKIDEPQTRGFIPDADDDLKRWIKKREKLGLGPGAIFCTVRRPAGGPLQPRYMRWLTDDLRKKAGVYKRVNPHIFRHSFAMYLVRRGFDIITISKLLGHENPSYTMVYLDHLTNGEAIRALHNYDWSSPDDKKKPTVSEPEDWFDDYEEW
jgi:integrase/recombinase XerC